MEKQRGGLCHQILNHVTEPSSWKHHGTDTRTERYDNRVLYTHLDLAYDQRGTDFQGRKGELNRGHWENLAHFCGEKQSCISPYVIYQGKF